MTSDDHRAGDAPRIRISSPSALIGAIPHLLGFPPESSLVILVIGDGVLRLSARVDLPDADVPITEWSTDVAVRLRPTPGDEAILVVYPRHPVDSGEDLPEADTIVVVRECLEALGVDVLDALVTDAARWWSYLCRTASCCPTDGRPVSSPDESLVRSALVYAGLAPVASRAAMAAEFAPADVGDGGDMARARRRREDARARIGEARALSLASREERANRASALIVANGVPSWDETAEVLDALGDIRVRDTVLWDLTHTVDSRAWRQGAERLLHCLHHAVGAEVAPVATTLAIVHWQLGDGARAREAIRRARAADPDYRLAHLIESALSSGMNPSVWSESLRDLDRRACLGETAPRLHRSA